MWHLTSRGFCQERKKKWQKIRENTGASLGVCPTDLTE